LRSYEEKIKIFFELVWKIRYHFYSSQENLA
jgi:hypothetical protein